MATEIVNIEAAKSNYYPESIVVLMVLIAFAAGYMLRLIVISISHSSTTSTKNTNDVTRKEKHSDTEENDSTDENSEDEEETESLAEYRHTKMVLIIRTDLEMTKGKVAAQCCHACLAAYKSSLLSKKSVLKAWKRNGQPKITLKCSSEDELLMLQAKALSLDLIAEVIADAGRTQIAPGSLTVLAIGPDYSEIIDSVTGRLKLY